MSVYSLVGHERQTCLRELVERVLPINGVMVEVGVYKGGTAATIASAAPAKHLFAFDTFSGIPFHDDTIDGHRAGDFSDTSIDEVRDNLKHIPNVSLHQGIFPDATGDVLKDLKVAFVHLDVDVYESNKRCLEFLYPKLLPGAIVVFDDWEWKQCHGIKKSIVEFLADKPEMIVKSTEMQAYFVKAFLPPPTQG